MNRKAFWALLFTGHWLLATGRCFSEALQEVRVKDGDTLWGIAQHYLKDPTKWPEILKYNSLPSQDPTVALPGTVLKVPVAIIKESLRSASLVFVQNDARFRRKNTTDWQRAKLKDSLFNDDHLRTMEGSLAHVRFYTGDVLKLEENSMVILRPEAKKEEAQLVSGAARTSQVQVVTASAKITPKTRDTDYRTKIKENLTTMVQVYKGAADVEAQGKVVRVPAGFGSEVRLQEVPSEPIPLPPMPELDQKALAQVPTPGGAKPAPGTGSGASSGGNAAQLSGDLTLTLAPPELSQEAREIGRDVTQGVGVRRNNLIRQYRIQVAKDTAFAQMVLDKTYPIEKKINFRNEGLTQGHYFWRFAYVDALGLEGNYTDPKAFDVKEKAYVLTVLEPQNGALNRQEFVHVEGLTDPGSSVEVNGKPADVDMNGKFLIALLLPPGRHTLTIIAKDRDGRTATATVQIIQQ